MYDEALGVLPDDLDGLGAAAGVGEPLDQAVAHAVGGLERCRIRWMLGASSAADQARLQRDQPDQRGLLVVLVGEIEHGAAAAGDVARDLQDPASSCPDPGHRRCRTRSPERKPPLRCSSSGDEAGRPDAGGGVRARLDAVVGLLQGLGQVLKLKDPRRPLHHRRHTSGFGEGPTRRMWPGAAIWP